MMKLQDHAILMTSGACPVPDKQLLQSNKLRNSVVQSFAPSASTFDILCWPHIGINQAHTNVLSVLVLKTA